MDIKNDISRHPSERLHPDWIEIIRKDAFSAEYQKHLTESQLQLCYHEKWFLALAPKIYGGLEWSLPEVVAFEESIGWADGSTGWVFTLCSGAGWFGGFLEENFAKKIFSKEKVCFAGSGAATGTAAIQEDGSYLVNGKWAYASGSLHATIFTANCQIVKNGEPILENGIPLILPFCFSREEVEIVPTWNEIGLVASAGHSFKIENLKVPSERAFKIDASARVVSTPIYQFPFMQLAAATLAANYSGMCIHFIELFKELIQTKKGRDGILLCERESVQSILANSILDLEKARLDLFGKVESTWQYLIENQTLSAETEQIFPLAQALTQTCRNIVNTLFPYCGLSIMRADTPISQVWRDFQTGSQHAMFCPA